MNYTLNSKERSKTAKLSALKKKYKRIIIAYWDFEYTLRFIELLLNKLKHVEKVNEEHVSLYIAIVITYCKSFLTSNDYENSKYKLNIKSISNFTKEEKILHKRIIDLRKQEIAHSDSSSYSVTVNITEIFDQRILVPISRDIFIPFNITDLNTLQKQVKKIINWLSNEISYLQKELNHLSSF